MAPGGTMLAGGLLGADTGADAGAGWFAVVSAVGGGVAERAGGAGGNWAGGTPRALLGSWGR